LKDYHLLPDLLLITVLFAEEYPAGVVTMGSPEFNPPPFMQLIALSKQEIKGLAVFAIVCLTCLLN
jgi:hypothetical protein